MKFSVLLPTRNRLDLLRFAVETVRRQDYDDWEAIISDNFSEEDIEGYVRSLGDPRIKYFRTARFVPVTENWNHALEKSSGDYVIMLGDDDCLMRGYLSTAHSLAEKFHSPDFIYTKAFLYAYPNVMPGYPGGFLNEAGCAGFFHISREPFLLDCAEARKLVKDSMNFRLSFDYNMQYFLIRREFIGSISDKGKFFQSSYPDYYAANVLFLKAKKILICPIPLVTIGISPKSFGYFYFNKRERQGVEFLKNLPDASSIEHLRHVILPGTEMNTFWMLAMDTIQSNYGSEIPSTVNYRRYRFLQIVHMFKTYFLDDGIPSAEFSELWRRMRIWEKTVYGSSLWLACQVAKWLPSYFRKMFGKHSLAVIGQYPEVELQEGQSRYANILEVFEQVDPLHHP